MGILTTDRDLLTRFRNGENEALRRVYREYARPLAGFLQRGFSFSGASGEHRFAGITSAYELDSALQEIFSRAFSDAARARYDGLRPFSSYLFAIARNWVIDAGRKQRARRFEVQNDGALADAVAESSEAATTLEADEIKRLLDAFLAGRDALDRQLYTLRFSEELSQTDAALRLATTRIRVRRREAKMLHDLLRHLRAHGYLTHARIKSSSLTGVLGASVIAELTILILSTGRTS